ncbi:RsbRD N-terminal domain-containing protein [Desulfopila aestuarii]|uniref:RsbT co-antagonist protein rsbRD N-terminal domain-containing protein n=1 Tax=Desulfopila aestuarii DSM 18488 TaxID=1121416 RepID=A0A1M7YAS0_9BACT|nr:RsbRD N-terminal domain-containing protein [Desulfopila aestuarii]SHO49707.1 RsbT co-antagonist protein rsbRD N-terminal domain-containing protein [Desulfopila aestuarii DSM 18488]
MDLAEAFRNYRETIVGKWVDYTLSTYTSSDFFKREKDQFANPIGASVREALDSLFVMMSKGTDPVEFKGPVEKIIKIRAVQEFTPAQAVAPLNAVKHITREVLAADKERAVFVKDLYDFEFNVDLAVLAAFDIYMESRERLYKVRIAEIKSGSHILTDSKCPSKLLNEESQEFLKSV